MESEVSQEHKAYWLNVGLVDFRSRFPERFFNLRFRKIKEEKGETPAKVLEENEKVTSVGRVSNVETLKTISLLTYIGKTDAS